MVAIEVIRLDPTAIISSPANTRGAVDHVVKQQFAVTILECKGVDDRDRIPIRKEQLWEYAFGRGPHDTIHVLPSRPRGQTRPWTRDCKRPCCGPRGCRACPRDERSWTGLEPWIKDLSPDDRIQPWFAHWAWCVPSWGLASHLGVSRPRKASGDTHLEWEDEFLASLPGAVRLCHGLRPRPDGRSTLASTADVVFETQDWLTEPEDAVGELRDGDERTPPLVVLQRESHQDLVVEPIPPDR